MSDSEHSLITYTSVPSPVEDYSDIGSPEVDGPPSPDYMPGPEEPKQAPLSPDYVPGPEEPEQAPPSPVYLLYGDPEEDDEEDPKEDPADSTVVALPAVDHVASEEVTEPLPQIPSPPLPIPSLPPNSPTHIEIPESCLSLQKRLRFASPTPSQEVGESSAAGAARQDELSVARDDPYSELDYGITNTWDELAGAINEIAPTTLQGVNQRVIDLSTIVEQETTIMYGIMEDAQDDRSQLRGRVNLLYRDRHVHRRLAAMIEREAKMAREAWGISMDARDNARSDFMSLRTTLVAQYALILDLQASDRRRHGVIKELLAADHKRQVQLTNALRAATLVARDANRNGDDSHTSRTGRPVQVARECTYPDFLKCQPLNFKGTEGVVRLRNALIWWNSHVKTTTPEAAHAMPWRTLKKMMTDKYFPKGKIKKLEFKM
nr:hypothetical protein [Tanacetum cinerariifolium]